MNSRGLRELLNTASSAPRAAAPNLAQRVWERIEQGWDPEFIEWQRWVKRMAPWAAVLVVLVTLTVTLLPHGDHKAPQPPALSLFAQPAGEFTISPSP